ncbi:MAG TPA: Ig-like domain-containing protein [Candidatus Acidoferrales bacterium]|jgi:plastocyanin|nr:Ig-like domain-containing protein [Candidatus Acidoferrales bacterium]
MKFTIKNITIAVTAAVSLWIASVQSGYGAMTNVFVGANGSVRFSPTNVTISVNDSVIWTWQGSDHSTTSGTNGTIGDDNGVPSGSWGSGVQNIPFTFTNTFTSAGIFSYYCSVHHNFGMTGQVFVVSSSLPPSLAITSPLNGAVLAAPANVAIQAAVTNGSGTVTNVQFLEGSTVLANATTAPFSAAANNLAAGNYTLTAIALDDNNLSATDAVSISVVTPVTVALTNVFRLSGTTNFQFSYSANPGLNYVVSRSADFINWVPLATNMAESNPVVFTDLTATNDLDFYRVGLLPNP